jgi:hypothetical protein
MSNMTSNHGGLSARGHTQVVNQITPARQTIALLRCRRLKSDLSYLYAALFGSRQEIISEAFGTRRESGWGHLGCKIGFYAIVARQSLISIGDSELINMSARAMFHPYLATGIVLDKKFAIFVSHLFVRLLTQPSRG